MEFTNLQTGEILYRLTHWYTSDESPHIAGCRDVGYFTSPQGAEDHHNLMLVKGLLLDEK